MLKPRGSDAPDDPSRSSAPGETAHGRGFCGRARRACQHFSRVILIGLLGGKTCSEKPMDAHECFQEVTQRDEAPRQSLPIAGGVVDILSDKHIQQLPRSWQMWETN